MACAKVRKVDTENQAFKEEDKYALILPAASVKPLCLICSETVALMIRVRVKRPYVTNHRSFEQTYPHQSEVRARKINELKAQYDRSTRVLFHAFTAQQRANECSQKIAWILGQHQKPFTDGGVVMECMNAAAETLLDGKQKDELCEKIKQIPMPRTTTTRKSEILVMKLFGVHHAGH